MPIVPVQAGPRSERMSPNRFDATTTLKRSGLSTNSADRISMWYLSHLMSGKFFAIASTRSSQYGIVIAMPFDLVAEVRCFFGVFCASSKANFSTRSTPMRVNTVSCTTISRSVPGNARPPIDEYSPFGVLAHHPEVDVARLAVRERRRHARHQPHRAQVDVLVELATEQDQRAPQRDVIRDLRRPADRAEEDRVVLADLLLPVLRHHAFVLGVVVVGGEVEPVLPHLEAELLRHRLERAHALRHDLLADAVARNDGDTIDAIGRHRTFPWTLPGVGDRGLERPRVMPRQ